MAKEPRHRINAEFSYNEFLAMHWALRDVLAGRSNPYPPEKQTVEKLGKEERRFRREYGKWKAEEKLLRQAARVQRKRAMEGASE